MTTLTTLTNINYYTIAAYALGLLATLVLAAWLTPARWWRRPNVRALAILAGGTWGLGTLLMGLVQAPAIAAPGGTAGSGGTTATFAAPRTAAATARNYRVRDDLNLRAATGIGAPRLAVVPAGSVVTTTGRRDGDWWELRANVDGRELTGWSSSLWLRRAEESRQ